MKLSPQKVATVKATNFRVDKLKKHKCYKFYVTAKDKKGKVIAKSLTSHVITANSEGKYTNAKSLTVKKKSVKMEESVSKTAQKKPGMESLLGACCYQEERTPDTWAIQIVTDKYFNGRFWPMCPGSSLLAYHIF
jgi:hypothetical protein